MPAEQGALPGYQILVVDDEQAVLELMVEILETSGWTVEGHTSPVEALRRVKLKPFDALIVDLYMPGLPGMLLHAKLKVIDSELARRTMFVTGHFSREELRCDLEASATVLLKPFEPHELTQAVEQILPARPRSNAAG